MCKYIHIHTTYVCMYVCMYVCIGRNKQLAQACAKIRSLQSAKPKENVPMNKPETSEHYLKEKPPVQVNFYTTSYCGNTSSSSITVIKIFLLC